MSCASLKLVPSARLERFGADFSVGWTAKANVCTVDVRAYVFAPVRLHHAGPAFLGHQFRSDAQQQRSGLAASRILVTASRSAPRSF